MTDTPTPDDPIINAAIKLSQERASELAETFSPDSAAPAPSAREIANRYPMETISDYNKRLGRNEAFRKMAEWHDAVARDQKMNFLGMETEVSAHKRSAAYARSQIKEG